MLADGWLKPSLIFAGLAPASVQDLARTVAPSIAALAGMDRSAIEAAFLDAMQGEGVSLGSGVVIPHIEIEGVEQTMISLMTFAEPLGVKTTDGRAADILFFVLAKPDPYAHLLLLAHLARLAHSRTLLDGIRKATTPEEVLNLVRAAEMRLGIIHPGTPPAPATRALVIVSVSGEKMVDALIIDLVDLGFADACILEAQSLREAAAREVPLFAGFRDLFGDPGGRRVMIVDVALDRADGVVEAVRKAAELHHPNDVRVFVLPVAARWIGSTSSAGQTTVRP